MWLVKGRVILIQHIELFLHGGFAGVGSISSIGSRKNVSAREVVRCFYTIESATVEVNVGRPHRQELCGVHSEWYQRRVPDRV